MGWKIVMVMGFAFEAIGLMLAARGFWQTWRANAGGRQFFSPRFQRLFAWVRVHVLHRQPRTHQVTGAVDAAWTVEGAAVGVAPRALTDDMTLEERLQVVQENAVRALVEASGANAAIKNEVLKRRTALTLIERRLAGAQDSMASYAKGLVVDGVPLAIGGLSFAVAGLLVQAVASIAAF